MTATVSTLDMLSDLVAKAKRAGADAADAVFVEGVSVSHARRLGKLEKLERAEGHDMGLRVFIGKRQAVVSSNDRSPKALNALIERAIAMAKAGLEDPYCGLADPADIAKSLPDLDLIDPVEPSAEVLMERARAAEETAMAVKGVTNSEGADASWGTTRVALAASNGFVAEYGRSSHSVSVAVIAGEGTSMERDYDWSSAVHGEDLDDAAKVGREAGLRAVRRLNPQKIETTKLPIVLDPRVSGSIVRHLTSAINGASIARGTSYLKTKMGEIVFAPGISIIEDPFRKRGLASKPVDGEGIAPQRRAIIDKGRLTTWILDLRSARQLGLKSTGHAARGTTSPPSPATTNVYMEAGTIKRDAMIKDIKRGLYVSEFIGMGVNGVTGDYSRGAAGYMIENGELTFPVSEVTVAGNLIEIFKNLTPADDLVFRHGTDAPTLRIDGCTIAGR